MNKRNILYGAIVVVCIICIIIVVYHQIFSKKVVNENKISVVNNVIEEQETIDNPKDILDEFNSLFNNKFESQDSNIQNVDKLEGFKDEDLVFTYNYKGEKDNYSIDLNVPTINIEKAAKLNETTRKIFIEKAENIISGAEKYTIYNVEYTSYLNDNILSLVIKATLKEGENAQRVIVQTYNYNIESNQEVSLNEILEIYGFKTKDVNKKIDRQVEEASKRATTISQATGQIVYKRNLSDSMYSTDKASNYFIGKDGQIYIVYAYGNNNITSEIDIIKV